MHVAIVPGLTCVKCIVVLLHTPKNVRRIPVLPPSPWVPSDDIVVEQVVDNEDREDESPVPSSIDVINRVSDDEDDDDLSLSLYVGAENANHRLCENRSCYKDFSNIPFAEVAVICNDPDKQSIFPVLLHSIVSGGQHCDSIQWLPHGRAFEIIDAKKFFAQVAPKYIYSNDPTMFMKLAEAYGFQMIGCCDYSGTETIIIYHEVSCHISTRLHPSNRIICSFDAHCDCKSFSEIPQVSAMACVHNGATLYL